MTKVWVNGTFDLLHAGHLALLKEAKARGDFLVVGLNSDSSVKAYKSKDRPINNQEIRKKKLLATGLVNEVIIFEEPNPIKIIKKVNPDLIVKGHDQKIEPELAEFKFYRAKQFGDISTTKILSEKK